MGVEGREDFVSPSLLPCSIIWYTDSWLEGAGLVVGRGGVGCWLGGRGGVGWEGGGRGGVGCWLGGRGGVGWEGDGRGGVGWVVGVELVGREVVGVGLVGW